MAKHSKRTVAYQIQHQKHVSPDVMLAELLGSELESGQSPTAVGDQGTSFGIFQIHLPAHPGITAAQAENVPTALELWRGAYTRAVARVGQAAFKANPERAAEQAAYIAEAPKYDYYTTRGQAGVDAAFAKVRAEVKNPNLGPTAGYKPLGGSSGVYAHPATLNANAQAAAKAFRAAGESKERMAIDLAALGAATNGTYDKVTTSHFVAAIKRGALPDVSRYRTSAGWLSIEKYLPQAYANLKKAGLPFQRNVANPATGDPGRAIPLGPTGGAATGIVGGVFGGVDSVAKAFEWIFNPDHILQAGVVLLGVFLVIVGVWRLSGAQAPPVVPLPV